MVNLMLFRTLPIDIIREHIIPFTYLPQKKELLRDIQSFQKDLSFIENLYFTEFNDNVLLIDLIRFCSNNHVAPFHGIHIIYEKFLRRNFTLSNKTCTYINEFVFSVFHSTIAMKPNKKIKFLWGLLTPTERTRFINKILDNLQS
jgi:hypothetical protein